MNEIAREYEKNIKTTYSELKPENPSDPDFWGNAIYNGNPVNVYTDRGVIHDLFTRPVEAVVPDKDNTIIGADLGGSEGTVANAVQDQLREEGYSDAHVVNYELIEKSLELMQSKFPQVLGVKADLKELPLHNDTIDFAILRFVLPYLNREGQCQVIKNAFAALKPQGKLII